MRVSFSKSILFYFLALLLWGCQAEIPVETATPTAMDEPESTQESIVVPEPIVYERITVDVDDDLYPIPYLWTEINPDYITIYPFDRITDYAYDQDGTLWTVGGFGVISLTADGEQTWYSIKNGLVRQFFTVVAVSPSGEVWIGGPENALFRFDGTQWIDEGIRLPEPADDVRHWLCYSKTISGIDFDQTGQVWVMNNGLELYTRYFDHWLDYEFPKSILPYAGGGGCPLGLYVESPTDITIERSRCCGLAGTSTWMHFDGATWITDDDYGAENNLQDTHRSFGYISTSEFLDWPFDSNNALPYNLYSRRGSLFSGEDGVIWLKDWENTFNNISGRFQGIDSDTDSFSYHDPNQDGLIVLNFGTSVLYYKAGWDPYFFARRISDIPQFNRNERFAVDDQERVWFYHYEEGLGMVDLWDLNLYGKLSEDFNWDEIGGIFAREDESVLVGSIGTIWEYDQGRWQEHIFSDIDELITNIVEDDQRIIYAASDTGVYQLEAGTYTRTSFVFQHYIPTVRPVTGEPNCVLNKRYMTYCNYARRESLDYQYTAVYLGVQADGSVVYVNNHIVAKYQDGLWQSYLFDSFEIDSAAVDLDGNIWIFSGSDGLFQLSAEIFE